VLTALEKNDWNVTETARQLDLARSHLYNLINDFELRREDSRDTTSPREAKEPTPKDGKDKDKPRA
jgi:hypothetical protein